MFTTLLEFFALGTIGFYILLAFISVVFITCIENEHYVSPTVISLVLATVYWKSLYALRLDWRAILIGVLAYVVVGAIWSFFRWFRFIKRLTDEYKESPSEGRYNSLKSDLKVSNNKSRITGWIAYWPWSLLWNITGDFFKMIYEGLQGVYQKIADKALSGIPVPEEKKKRDEYGH